MKKFIPLLFVLALGVVLAHSRPVKIAPANGSTVKSAKSVMITFDEAVESGFGTFKVYPYSGALTDDAMDSFSDSKLKLKNDAAARADSSTTATGSTKNITINLKPNLKAGTYLVMWRILGADTHSLDGNSFFRIKP